jgi:glycosyltransferase involved in cell wall biosynthesis
MSCPCISVILPVRNAAATLPAALESIHRQTHSDWELLVIDDGSTDGSLDLARQFARRDSRIQCRAQPAWGLVAALHHGLRHARGEYLARMDADDLSHADRFRLQVAALNEDPRLGLVSCRVSFGGDRHHHRGYALHVDWANRLLTPEAIRLNRFIESPLPHPSVCFRRTLLDQFGSYQEGRFPEDYELWLRWLDAGVRMSKVDRELVTWNDLPHRLSRTDPRYSASAFYAIKAQYLARQLHRDLRGRQLWIWGAGRLTRRRAELLETHGLAIHGFIDIDPRKTRQRPGARPVVLPHQLPGPTQALIAVFVANRGARDLIRHTLTQRRYLEGRDFWVAA